MKDEPPVRLRPRKSTQSPKKNPRKDTGVPRSMLRLVQMSRGGRETGSRYGEGRVAGSARTPRTFNQRVAVRVSYSTNKSPGQWKAHGRYVARESATQGGRAAEAGFNATNQNIAIATTLDNWQSAGDERLFKLIVSPEFADRLNLQQHARDLMQRMQRDLGTQFEWVAAVHHTLGIPTFTSRFAELTTKEERFAYRGNTFVRTCVGGPKKSLPKPWAIARRRMLKRRSDAK